MCIVNEQKNTHKTVVTKEDSIESEFKFTLHIYLHIYTTFIYIYKFAHILPFLTF